ncbi:MAG: polyphenol oxidase family protein [Nitrospirota bacterium]
MPVAAHRVEPGQDGEWIVLAGFSAPHRFGTRRFPASSVRSIGGAPVLTARQVHKDGVLAVASGGQDAPRWQAEAASADADGVATDRSDCWVGVVTADCVPLLLHDPVARTAAAVHAGWRGALMGVAPAAVRTLATRFGADPSRLEAAIGPHIGACCFEVGHAVLDPLSKIPGWERWIAQRSGEKGYFDLGAFVRWQLETAGLAPTRMTALGLCTRCDPSRFSSYRREGRRPPGMLSAVRVGPRA